MQSCAQCTNAVTRNSQHSLRVHPFQTRRVGYRGKVLYEPYLRLGIPFRGLDRRSHTSVHFFASRVRRRHHRLLLTRTEESSHCRCSLLGCLNLNNLKKDITLFIIFQTSQVTMNWIPCDCSSEDAPPPPRMTSQMEFCGSGLTRLMQPERMARATMFQI